MKKAILVLAIALVAMACSGKSNTAATESVEETQDVQVEVMESTTNEEVEVEATEETTSEETTEETTTEEGVN